MSKRAAAVRAARLTDLIRDKKGVSGRECLCFEAELLIGLGDSAWRYSHDNESDSSCADTRMTHLCIVRAVPGRFFNVCVCFFLKKNGVVGGWIQRFNQFDSLDTNQHIFCTEAFYSMSLNLNDFIPIKS